MITAMARVTSTAVIKTQAASNTFGLVLCMFFLGYGLIELPR